MIKLDKSAVSGILVRCTSCEYWFAFRDNPIDAYLAGESHEQGVHDVPAEIADNARRLYEKRHAARS